MQLLSSSCAARAKSNLTLTDFVGREGVESAADLRGVSLAGEVAQAGAVHGEVGTRRPTPECIQHKRRHESAR